MATIFILVAVASAVAAAWRYGADSRDGRDWSLPLSQDEAPPSRKRAEVRPSPGRDAALVLRQLQRSSAALVVALHGPRHLGQRFVRLFAGLIGFGVSLALMVKAQLGLGPWDVLHQGIAARTGSQIGTVVIGVSVLVLLLWIPLRQSPGIGTLANAVVVGLALNAALTLLPAPEHLYWRVAFLVIGIVGNGVATGLYIGAGLGPGPRDGLMTGLAQRGYSIRRARTAIELSVLGLGWLLGGTVGVGTVAYALAIGPLAHFFLPRLSVTPITTGERHDSDGFTRRRSRGGVAPTRLQALGDGRARLSSPRRSARRSADTPRRRETPGCRGEALGPRSSCARGSPR